MTTITELVTIFNQNVTAYGQRCRLKYYTFAYSGALYDDGYLAVSGTNIWLNGRHSKLSSKTSSEDYTRLQQGKILHSDSVLYLSGSVTTGINISGITTKIGIGSPTPVEYYLVETGKNIPNISGTVIFHKLYIRILNNGSFAQEV